MANKNAIVIGAGIAGLAMARALSLRGFHVKVFERGNEATGASIRNFGMIWPIGQPDGLLYERALRSRSIWKEISGTGAFSTEDAGSLHVAYDELEWKVLQELYESFKVDRDRPLRDPRQRQGREGAPRTRDQTHGCGQSRRLRSGL